MMGEGHVLSGAYGGLDAPFPQLPIPWDLIRGSYTVDGIDYAAQPGLPSTRGDQYTGAILTTNIMNAMAHSMAEMNIAVA